MTGPEIHTWWPYLPASAKSALDRLGESPLPLPVRVEILRITGEQVSSDHRLTEQDRVFIRTQRERVD